MKKIILISVILFCSYSYAQQNISDTTLTALEGEKVEIKLNNGASLTGLLKKVGETAVVIVYDNGSVAEISKSDISSIKISGKSSKKSKKSSYKSGAGVMRPAVPIVLNVFLPFGIGSWIQKDIKTGITLSVLDALWIASLITAGSVAVNQFGYPNNANLNINSEEFITAVAVSVVTIAAFGISRLIVAIVGPVKFYKKNSVSIIPRILPETTGAGVHQLVGVQFGFDLVKRF